jgi:hypothetical protein
MMTHDEMIAVIQHHKNGGKVEYMSRAENTWTLVSGEPLWNFAVHDYRIKPEPMVIFAEVSYITGKLLRTSTSLLLHENDNTTIKKFIEAL